MITDQMKDKLFSMRLGVLLRHSGSRLSFELEPDKVYYISKNGTKVYIFSKDVLNKAYDEGRKFLYMLDYKQVMHSSLKKGDK
jgi:hypothetical protein